MSRPAPNAAPVVFQHMGRGPLLKMDGGKAKLQPTVVSQKPCARNAVCPQPHTVPLASTASAPTPCAVGAFASYVLKATPRTPTRPPGHSAVVTRVGVTVLLFSPPYVYCSPFWFEEPQQYSALPLAGVDTPHVAYTPVNTEAKSTGEGTTPGMSTPTDTLVPRPHCPNWQ